MNIIEDVWNLVYPKVCFLCKDKLQVSEKEIDEIFHVADFDKDGQIGYKVSA